MNNQGSCLERIVNPRDGSPLRRDGDFLITHSGQKFAVCDGIADILDPLLTDQHLTHELAVFEHAPLEGACYFRPPLMEEVVDLLSNILPSGRNDFSCVEIGGGEGFFARTFKKRFTSGQTFICDISRKHLINAPEDICKIRCDARQYYLALGSIDVAVFWVSLHHLNREDMKQALERAVEVLAPGGLLLLFEPNSLFFPRHIVLNTFLKRLVYIDDEEKLINSKDICGIVRLLKMKPLFVEGHNPPYNPAFLKQLRGGWLFYPFVEIMYLLERSFRRGSFEWRGGRIKRQRMLRSGSYVLAIFSKETYNP